MRLFLERVFRNSVGGIEIASGRKVLHVGIALHPAVVVLRVSEACNNEMCAKWEVVRRTDGDVVPRGTGSSLAALASTTTQVLKVFKRHTRTTIGWARNWVWARMLSHECSRRTQPLDRTSRHLVKFQSPSPPLGQRLLING